MRTGCQTRRSHQPDHLTRRHRIAGTLTLAAEGYRSRVSDVLNSTERDFISLTDVTVELTPLHLYDELGTVRLGATA